MVVRKSDVDPGDERGSEEGMAGTTRLGGGFPALVGAGAILVGLTLVPLASAGTLALHAEIHWKGGDVNCPAGLPSTVVCHPHPGRALVPGLGEVTQAYVFPLEQNALPPACKAKGGVNVLGYRARLVVKGKGEIRFAVSGIPGCFFGPPPDTVVNNTQPFTITGGSGRYVGASGTGTLTHVGNFDPSYGHAVGIDTWTGTLVVPGLEFDLTAPTISGAANKVVRAPPGARKARVTFNLSARDDVDGSLPVSCKPRSGSLFKVGRTRVTCSATDTSGNRATATFTVTVKQRR
jgi:HYR domain